MAAVAAALASFAAAADSEAQASAESPAEFRRAVLAPTVSLGQAPPDDPHSADPAHRGSTAASTADSVASVAVARVMSVAPGLVGSAYQGWTAPSTVDSAASASVCRVSSVDPNLAGSVYLVLTVASSAADLPAQASAVPALADSALPALLPADDCRPDDFQEDCSPVGSPVHTADGYTPAGSPADTEADTHSVDNANCLDTPDGWHTPPVADDTTLPADDKDSPNLPNKRDCNKRAVLPNSIPSRPIPKADYRQSAPQSRSPHRN